MIRYNPTKETTRRVVSLFQFLSKSYRGIKIKKWILSVAILIAVPALDVDDVSDKYFHNVIWFFYLIPTIICVFKKGRLFGFIATAVESILFYVMEAWQKDGISNSEFLTFLELLMLNILISITVGALVKGNNDKQNELKEAKTLLESIFNHLDLAIWSDNFKGEILTSKGIEKIYGKKSENTFEDAPFWKKAVYSGDEFIIREIEKKVEKKEGYNFIYRIERPDGEIRWVKDRGMPVFNENGEVERYDGTITDITRQKQLALNLKESQERYRTLIENVFAGVYLLHNDAPVFVNQWFVDFMGISKKELLSGTTFLNYVVEEDRERLRVNFQSLIDGKKLFFIDEIQVLTHDGTAKYLELQAATTIINGSSAIAGLALDVTDKKMAKAKLEHLAFHDGLTGLPNMNYLNHYLSKEYNAATSNGKTVCVMYFNLDRFKFINDSFGHRIGDRLLMYVSQRLVLTIQSSGDVVRAGGDDFIIYLENSNRKQAKQLAEKLLDAFAKPFHFDGQEIRIAASIGISIAGQNETLEGEMRKASAALHFAKECGRNQYRFYAVEFLQTANRKMELEQRLRKALEQEILEVYYQPKLDLRTKKITGMEALVRWNDSEIGTVSPTEFIPLAEETGMIVPLGKWVLETACKQNIEWQKMGYDPIHVCVNISSRQFLQDDFVFMIEQSIQNSGLAPEYLNLEITEGIALNNMEDAIWKLKKLKKLGIRISLDDFGTGYSSLSYIKSLPIDFLKIDRAFINGITENHQDAAIIDSIISLAQSFDFRVVAEGVEDERQMNMLTAKNCDEIQGFYFAKPMPSFRFKQFLDERMKRSLYNL
jgi:diguanylate cyclase (GGDEF)-like protein/PAS domain S-box-containing protein